MTLSPVHPGSYIPLGHQPTAIVLPDSSCQIKPQVSLAPLTSFRVGGAAEWLVTPRTPDDMQASLDWAHREGLPVLLLGAGSNLLISDRGLPGLVVCTRHLRYSQFDAGTAQVTVAAGEPMVRLSWQAADRGWRDLEWAVGIPGTVGGAVVMNAGAHNLCMADILVSVHVLNWDGSIQLLRLDDLQYRYRHSILQDDRRPVLQATFQLSPGFTPEEVTTTTKAYLERRHATQPYHLPSCGSVFRNPTPHKAGKLIEDAGLKGFQIGGAQVAHLHANFILNCGRASANDIFQLIRHVQHRVQDRWNVWLEPEVKMVGIFQDGGETYEFFGSSHR